MVSIVAHHGSRRFAASRIGAPHAGDIAMTDEARAAATTPDQARADEATPLQEMGPEQGGGPPDKLPWTLEVEGQWSADLEHGAALPRVGERLEFITERGERQLFRVKEIVHTLQTSASERPRVRSEQTSPNALVDPDEATRLPRVLRAGLPRVVVVPEADEQD
jgi:hypothetical protein